MSHHPPFDQVQASRPDFDANFKAGFTKTPEPNFRPGQGLNSLPYAADFDPASPCRSINTADIPSGDMYKLMISAITPRPIAFLSTVGKDGLPNLAPFSYFNMVSHDPPAIMVSIGRIGSGLKDSNTNIKETGEFCVSIISEPFVEAMNTTALDAPYDVSEWELSGLTPRASETVKPPHVGESAFSMECTLLHWYDLVGAKGNNTMTVAIGKIERIHIKESVLVPGSDALLVAPEKLRPVSRMGGITYSRSAQFFEIPRPKWADVESTDDIKAVLAKEAKNA